MPNSHHKYLQIYVKHVNWRHNDPSYYKAGKNWDKNRNTCTLKSTCSKIGQLHLMYKQKQRFIFFLLILCFSIVFSLNNLVHRVSKRKFIFNIFFLQEAQVMCWLPQWALTAVNVFFKNEQQAFWLVLWNCILIGAGSRFEFSCCTELGSLSITCYVTCTRQLAHQWA